MKIVDAGALRKMIETRIAEEREYLEDITVHEVEALYDDDGTLKPECAEQERILFGRTRRIRGQMRGLRRALDMLDSLSIELPH